MEAFLLKALIVIIAGDSDFVPAAKLARREGIDFILDPMGANIDPTLFEHIDGLEDSSHAQKISHHTFKRKRKIKKPQNKVLRHKTIKSMN